MHPDTNNATLEDLWPGDVIIARRPGAYSGTPHRFVDTRVESNGIIIKLATLDGEREFEAFASDGWETPVERVA